MLVLDLNQITTAIKIKPKGKANQYLLIFLSALTVVVVELVEVELVEDEVVEEVVDDVVEVVEEVELVEEAGA